MHKLCSEVKDYKGCVEQSNQNNNKQALIVEEKLAKAFASLLCEDGNSFAELTTEIRSSKVALRTGPRYEQVLSESDFDRLTNNVRDKMQRISTVKCPKQQEAYIKKVRKIGNRGWAAVKPIPWADIPPELRGLYNNPTERPSDGGSVATWQSYCNSQGKTYYERTSGLSWFGIKLSNKKEWQGCLTDAEAAQSGAGGTTYTPVNPRPPVNCYGSGYATGGKSFNTKTTCY